MVSIRRRYLLGVLAVGIGLIVLSALVDSPVTDAAPNLFAGGVVIVLAVQLVTVFGPERTISTVTAIALAIGGLTTVYEGLAALLQQEPVSGVPLLGDVALLVGLVLFVYDWQFVR